MQDFKFRVQGLGPKPVVLSVTTRNAETAQAMAERMCRDATSLANIDVWQDKHYLFTVGRPSPDKDEGCRPSGCATDSSI